MIACNNFRIEIVALKQSGVWRFPPLARGERGMAISGKTLSVTDKQQPHGDLVPDREPPEQLGAGEELWVMPIDAKR